MKQKYAYYHIGGRRQMLTREELKKAIDLAFDDPKQENLIFGYSISHPMTQAEIEQEKNYDTLNK